MSAFGSKQASILTLKMSAFGSKADRKKTSREAITWDGVGKIESSVGKNPFSL